jgi:hypothetical protein
MRETRARIYRRHRARCKFFGVEDSWAMLACNCPLYGDGYIGGKRVLRKSLDTRNQAVASKKIADLMAEYEPKPSGQVSSAKPISEAVEAFLGHHGTIQDGVFKGRIQFSTYRKYRGLLRCLQDFFQERGQINIGEVGLGELDTYKISRHVAPKAWGNELQLFDELLGVLFEAWLGQGKRCTRHGQAKESSRE